MRLRALPFAPAILIAMIAYACLPSCGPSAREKAIKTTLVAVDTANDEFLKYDLPAQKTIVASANGNADVAEKRIAEYRKLRAKLVDAFVLVYQAIAHAATTSDSLGKMQEFAHQVVDAFADLKKAGSP